MDATAILANHLNKHHILPGKVVDYNASADSLYPLDLTAANTELTAEMVADTAAFSVYINTQLLTGNYRYAIGGYMEHRTVYSRSALFDTADEPRRLHLGTDIWGDAGLPVYSPFDATVHSFADNNHFGDYGPTIILQHDLGGLTLYSLYGHLSRASLTGLQTGQSIAVNQQIGTLGTAHENGSWPPHLHFQLMLAIGAARGDYLGVGKFTQKDMLLQNIADPKLVLGF
ncbi:peptidoglycan DD-metalloendopeptidase family protein [Mucilaginibacter sp.]|uniref:peptidoglycan DD-metalloendopeptidase family protein n=1 Tax=Mucilaginibacter sp. TaxID=1882438 RepID=UPI0035BBEA16